MHGDEEDLEAAGEETQHEQHVAGVAARLGERLRRRLLGSAAAAGAPALRGEASASDSGMMSSTSAAKMSSVSCQP